MNYRNISQLNEAILKNIDKVPFDIDLVVGIPRSGIIPGSLIALYRNIPYVNLGEFESGIMFAGGERLKNYNADSIKRVLIIDDSLWSGKALSNCKQRIEKLPYNFNYIYGVVYVLPESKDLTDIYFEELPIPRVFQWNLFHHTLISNSCVDIDGVLCVDPTKEENDDGARYEDFILNARALYTPTVKINTIVSCRLEKYRVQTEQWLAEHNIEYNNLVLLDLPNKEARIKWGKYGEYKAKVYMQSSCSFFIESSLKQATTIAKITGKLVFCTETFDIISIPHSNSYYMVNRIKQKIKSVFKRITS